MDKLLVTKNEIKDSFNKIVSMICTHLGNKYPDTQFGKYKHTIHKYITELPYEPISVFIKYVYSNDIYRNKILAFDETFFINQSYDSYENYQDYSTQIFMMKDIWLQMDTTNKTFIKQAFKNLIERCDLYVDILCQINKIKK
jgi:hypothetical protein